MAQGSHKAPRYVHIMKINQERQALRDVLARAGLGLVDKVDS